jgi:hypothetical protein
MDDLPTKNAGDSDGTSDTISFSLSELDFLQISRI